MGVVSHVCVCVCTSDLEVTGQCVNSGVPFLLSSLLVLSFARCWSYSFHVFCLEYKLQILQCHYCLCMACMSMASQSFPCLQMPQNTNPRELCNTDHIYLFTSFQVQNKSILLAAYCFVLAVCVQIWPTSLTAQPERWFSYGMPLTLSCYFSIWHHVKICSKKRTLLAYIIFVESRNVYFSQSYRC